MIQIAQGASTVRTPELRGPAGRLEALYTPGSPDAAYAAVVCHPHPLYGGTMHNKVVYHAAKALQRRGMPVLRFNFRGAGTSEGTHDAGRGEQGDLLAALQWLAAETELPMLVAGFSFGGYVSLRTCCAGGLAGMDVRGLITLGLPIQAGDRGYTYGFLADCSLPKLFISGDRDAFGPVPELEAVVGHASPPAELVWVAGVDHFFQPSPPAIAAAGLASQLTPAGSGLHQMQAAIEAWLSHHFPEANTHPASADRRQLAE